MVYGGPLDELVKMTALHQCEAEVKVWCGYPSTCPNGPGRHTFGAGCTGATDG
jgi:hypothetical protein